MSSPNLVGSILYITVRSPYPHLDFAGKRWSLEHMPSSRAHFLRNFGRIMASSTAQGWQPEVCMPSTLRVISFGTISRQDAPTMSLGSSRYTRKKTQIQRCFWVLLVKVAPFLGILYFWANSSCITWKGDSLCHESLETLDLVDNTW